MKSLILIALILSVVSCAKKETYNAPAANPPASMSAPAEKTYPMTATIVSRDPAKNTVNLDNKEVPGEMAAMKMDYELRGAKVDSLPPDGSAVVVTVHDKNGNYWITDVKPQSKK